ncbi:MAG: DUF2182 domain-containing protein [Hoeflea sp.]|uniref:DUF2182 domain-containing protein n=1 Tax=Hoeflea sp. TaxID=1940281 RepID=UPI0032EF14B6
MFTPRDTNDPLAGRFDHLDLSGRATALLARRPVWPVFAMVAVTAALAWWFLLTMAGSVATLSGSARTLGPGMEVISQYLPVDTGSFFARIAALCLSADAGALAAVNPDGLALFPALAAMWFAMAAAMMLPTAAPMIRTYCEIADTAAVRGAPVVHPLMLTAGYLAVWSLAALLFAALHLALSAIAGTGGAAPLQGAVAGAILVVAGLYQFSSLKEACLRKCRNPFTTLFARWQTRAAGVFRLGMEQGLWCLGCCWALMLIMLAVGSMNVIWMAALTLFAFLEKTGSGRVTSRIVGAIVTLWGAALIIGSAT